MEAGAPSGPGKGWLREAGFGSCASHLPRRGGLTSSTPHLHARRCRRSRIIAHAWLLPWRQSGMPGGRPICEQPLSGLAAGDGCGHCLAHAHAYTEPHPHRHLYPHFDLDSKPHPHRYRNAHADVLTDSDADAHPNHRSWPHRVQAPF